MIGFSFLKELDSLQQEVDAIFGNYGQSKNERLSNRSNIVTHHYPRITLGEDVDNFYLEMLAPGMDPQSLDISLTGNSLSLSGERQKNSEENISWQRQERSQGKFMRVVELPLEVDTESINAEYVEGVLRVLLPKAEAVKPKRISIKTAA